MDLLRPVNETLNESLGYRCIVYHFTGETLIWIVFGYL
ncbi:hypothetical protein T08_5323 [Trichinella sp. T8]|nr:hypothetical protein T08_5323 [Trichinella sp. T8]